MGWQDLLGTSKEIVVFPWVGGRSIRKGAQTWKIQGKLPREHCWGKFEINSKREAIFESESEESEVLSLQYDIKTGYLVGDRFVSDLSGVDPDPLNTE